MSDIEKRARELLAAEYERRGSRTYAESLRVTPLWAFGDDESAMGIRAIIAALTPPEGYVLVKVDLAESAMQLLYCASNEKDNIFASTAAEIRDLLAQDRKGGRS